MAKRKVIDLPSAGPLNDANDLLHIVQTLTDSKVTLKSFLSGVRAQVLYVTASDDIEVAQPRDQVIVAEPAAVDVVLTFPAVTADSSPMTVSVYRKGNGAGKVTCAITGGPSIDLTTSDQVAVLEVIRTGASTYVWEIKKKPEWDLIVDSDADLNLWINDTTGRYKSVYIKAGTWTAATLGPTAGVLFDLDVLQTKHVFAERGAVIAYTGAYAGTMVGFRHAVRPTDFTSEKFEGITLEMHNTDVAASYLNGFYNMVNLSDCKVTLICDHYIATGFYFCDEIKNCYSIITGGAGGAFGYNSCTNVFGCYGEVHGVDTTTSAFNGCDRVERCRGQSVTTSNGESTVFRNSKYVSQCYAISATSSGGGLGYGFKGCTYLSNCVVDAATTAGYSTCTSLSGCFGDIAATIAFSACTDLFGCVGRVSMGSAGVHAAFDTCITVVGCEGQGLNSGAGTGYGYNACKKMQQNKPKAASKTATYLASYADAGTANACADTAAGGYNS